MESKDDITVSKSNGISRQGHSLSGFNHWCAPKIKVTFDYHSYVTELFWKIHDIFGTLLLLFLSPFTIKIKYTP